MSKELSSDVEFLENGQIDWLKYDFEQHERFLDPSHLEDYGIYEFQRVKQIPQLTRELKLYYEAKQGNRVGRSKSAFHHALNVTYLLHRNETIEVCKDFRGYKCPNNYFLDNLHDLCEFRHYAFTGSASCAKTFTASWFGLLNFYAYPQDRLRKDDGTTILFTTTAGSHAERRGWGDLKKLHRSAKWDMCQSYEIGKVIEHLKCIVFDPGITDEKTAVQRDYRNGILVVPVGQDKSGEAAYEALIGTKNLNIHWIIDEGPVMPVGILDARINLSSAPFFQITMLGNATEKTDPHGMSCEPKEGWPSIDRDKDRKWEGKTMMVRFNHGEESPNDLYIPQDSVKTKRDLPYPYLSNSLSRKEMAIAAGNGDEQYGMTTMQYTKMAIGFWSATGVQQTVLSEGFVRNFHAHEDPDLWDTSPKRTFAGFDPAFTYGGDQSSIFFIETGKSIQGIEQCIFDNECININPSQSDKEEYRRMVAKRVVEICKNRNINIYDLGIDISNDGGLMMQQIELEWGETGVTGISSQGDSYSKKYKNKVSQYWLQLRELIGTGKTRGFNCSSLYAKDLFERRYSSDKNGSQVETKKEMKKRIRRSPDCFVSGTQILTLDGIKRIENISNNDLIITPFGFSKILSIVKTDTNYTTEVFFSDGSSLEGKPDHRIFAHGHGLVKMSELSIGMVISNDLDWPLWNLSRLLFSRVLDTTFKKLATCIATTQGLRSGFFIELSGKMPMEKFLMVIIYIIRMAIKQIMTSLTLRQSLHQITQDSIQKKGLNLIQATKNISIAFFRALGKKLKNGTLQKRAGNGTERMQKKYGQTRNGHLTSVSNAGSSLKQGLRERLYYFALGRAPKNQGIKGIMYSLMMYVLSVAISSKIGNHTRGKVVLAVVDKKLEDSIEVYDLILNDENAYYANGCLVENCGDAFAYAGHMVIKSGAITIESDKHEITNEQRLERIREWRRMMAGEEKESAYASSFADSHVGGGYGY